MKPRAVAAAVSTLMWLGAGAAATQTIVTPSSTGHLTAAQLQEWVNAVNAHRPGDADAALATIARWPQDRLYVLFTELSTLDAFRNNPRVATGPANNRTYPEPSLKRLPELLALTDVEQRTGDINRLLKRAVLLHTDIAVLMPSAATPVKQASVFTGRTTIEERDGRQVGALGTAVHLEFASWLLDGVTPDPSADDDVRLWYQTVAATALRGRHFGDAEWLLGRARRIFPGDALILFYTGTVLETLAAPRVQVAMRANALPTSSPVGGSAEQQGLARAAGCFERALEVDPEFAESRLHLGRVRGQLGLHAEAAAELTRATAALTNRTLQYYAALFLGHELDMTGDLEAARAQFEHASLLYPGAQSPLFAASELARRSGDSAGALAPLTRLLALPDDEVSRNDPWWSYEVSHVSDADVRLSAWRASFRNGGM